MNAAALRERCGPPPMLWASLPNASATVAAAQSCINSQNACHRSNCAPISGIPNSNPYSDLLTNQLHRSQFYSSPMRGSPWLRFSLSIHVRLEYYVNQQC